MSEEPKPRKNIFRRFYDWVIHWGATPYATLAAMLVAFTSAWLLPIPPDTLLIPVLLARPQKAIRLGLLATLFYALGWMVGYFIGYYGHLWFGADISTKLGIAEFLGRVKPIYDEYGLWAVLLGASTPLSDKLFSFGSGILQYDFQKYTLAVVVGCTIRVMGPALLLKFFGVAVQRFAEKYFEWVVFGAILLALLTYLTLRLLV